MSFTIENGYTPKTFDELLADYTAEVNQQMGTEYTPNSIVGTDWYRYGYAGIQMALSVENAIAAVTAKMTNYVSYYNSKLILPKSTPNGLMGALERELGVISSVKPLTQIEERGHLDICCDVDPSDEELKAQIIEKLGLYATAGVVFSGDQTGDFIGLNGQHFPIAYCLPTEKTFNVHIVANTSRNTTDFIPNENVVIQAFRDGFDKSYRLGYDFEPDVYLCKDALPWAAAIAVTYGESATDQTEVYKSQYNEKIILGQVTAEIIDE